MIRWIKDVGIKNKVIVIINCSDTETCKKERNNKVIFGYGKCEKYKEIYSGTQNAIMKCDCAFKIRSTSSHDGSGWKIDVKSGFHNHDLPDRL